MRKWAGLFLPLICLGQGCPGPAPAPAPPPLCSRQYYNSDFAFGIDPPAGATGPAAASRSGQDLALQWSEMTPISEALEIDVGQSGVTADLSALAQGNADSFASAGWTLLNSGFFSLPSGVPAWGYFIAIPEASSLAIGTIAVSRERIFTLRIIYDPNITVDQGAEIDAVVNSFCVE